MEFAGGAPEPKGLALAVVDEEEQAAAGHSGVAEVDLPGVSPGTSMQMSTLPSPNAAVRDDSAGGEEEEEEALCRICRGDGEHEALFAPCACRGSMEWVHPSCLQQWRDTSQNPESRVRCETCKQPYRLAAQHNDAYGFMLILCRYFGFAIAFIIASEVAILILGYLGLGLAWCTGISVSKEQWVPRSELHSYGVNAYFILATTLTILLLARRSYRKFKQRNPMWEGPPVAETWLHQYSDVRAYGQEQPCRMRCCLCVAL